MDQSSSDSNKVTILSNIVLTPQKRTSQDDDLSDSDIIDITIDDIDEESTSGEPLFKNLYFEPPTQHTYSKKRKQDSSLTERNEGKRIKTEKEVDLGNGNCDEIERVFNYMTGTYEPVRKSTDLRPCDTHVKRDPDLSVEELCLKEEPTGVGTDHPHVIDTSCSRDIISSQPSEEDEHIETHVTPNDISKETPILDTSNAPEVIPLAESPSPCNDDDSNHSIPSVPSPQVDESFNDTVIIDPKHNSISETTDSSAAVETSANQLKELVVQITPLSVIYSSSIISNVNSGILETGTDNSVQSDSSKAEQYFVNKLRDKLSLVNWDCKTCGYKAKTKSSLISHIYNEHLKDDYEIKIKCKSCNFECDNAGEMEQHEMGHEVGTSGGNSSTSPVTAVSESLHNAIIPQGDTDLLSRNTRPHTKVITNQNLVTPSNTEEILEISDDDLPSETETKHLRCFFCKYSTDIRTYLVYHSGRHNGKQYYCDDHFWISAEPTCPKCIFENIMSNLSKNLLTCKICGYSTMRGSYFKKHVSKPFSCQYYLTIQANKKKKIEHDMNRGSECSSQPDQNPSLSVSSVNISGALQDVTSNLQNDDYAAKNTENSKNIAEQGPVDDEIASTNASGSEIPEKSLTEQLNDENSVQNEEQANSEQPNLSLKNVEGSTEDIDNATSLNPAHTTEKSNSSTEVLKETGGPDVENSAEVSAEISETSVSANSSSKKRKNLDNSECDIIDLDVDESDSSQEKNFAFSFKCFDCDSDISKKDKLKTHALSCHPDSSYQCDLHQSKISFHECEKCIYELIFRNHQLERLLIDPFDVGSRRVPNLKANSSHSNGKQLSRHKESKKRDTDSNESDIEVIEVRITRATSLKRKGAGEQAEQNSQHQDAVDAGTDKTVTGTDKTMKVTCFDCDFKEYSKNDFVTHACRHIGSKYQCTEHWENLQEDCLKCRYELALRSLQKDVQHCKRCGFKTTVKADFDKHLEGNDCKLPWTLLPGEMMCFQCHYVTTHKYFLKCHMVDHLDQDFSCEKHPGMKDLECLECIHEDCLSGAKKEVAICKQCYFKTVNKEVFKEHKCGDKSIDRREKGATKDLCDEGQQAGDGGTLVVNGGLGRNADDEIEPSDTETDLGNDVLTEANNSEEEESLAANKHIENTDLLVDNQCSKEQMKGYTSRIILTEEDSQGRTKNVKGHAKNVTDKEETYINRCFDCDFSGSGPLFDKHVWRHIGSKYKCTEHLKGKLRACQQCRYVQVLKSARTIVKNCTGCGYSTNNNYSLTRHMDTMGSCSTWFHRNLRPGEIRCLVCHYMTCDKVLLKYHMVDHLDLTLTCDSHHGIEMEKCELCLNEKCLESAKKEVKRCNDCSFKTVIKQVFDAHNCKGNTAGITEKSIEQSGSNAEDPKGNDTSGKSIEDSAQNTCDSQPSITTTDNTVKPEIKAQCFDCKYSSSTNDQSFKEHICRHIGSKYQCMEHWKSNVNSCLKCCYEEALQRLKEEVETCNICGYKALDKLSLTRHTEVGSCTKGVDRNLKPEEITCLECQYVTTHRKFLTYHMVDHLDLTFSCDVHQETKNVKCYKCIYEKCLEIAKKDAMTCTKCNFKTAIKRVFKLHVCEDSVDGARHQGNEGTGATVQALENNGASLAEKDGNKTDSEKKSLTDNDNSQSEKEIGDVTTKELPSNIIPDEKQILRSETNTHSVESTETANLSSKTKERRDQCFDCNFTCPHRSYGLLKHICRHVGSKYQCIQHWKTKSDECMKCRYELRLKSAQKQVYTCKRCGYRSIENYAINRHREGVGTCINWRKRKLKAGEITCLGCPYVTSHKIFLTYHMVDHLDLKLPAHEHVEPEMCQICVNRECLKNAKKEVKTCEKCNYKTVIKEVFDLHGCKGKKGREVGGMEQSKLKAKCFDCKYSSSSNNIAFKEHICRHIGSKYQCMEHWKSRDPHCLKCQYEKVLHKLQKDVKTCKICGYKALDESSMTKHLKVFGSCIKWIDRQLQPEEIRCLECQYVTIHKKYLTYHMVDHLDAVLSCEVHPKEKNEMCEKCINEECLEGAKKGVKRCEKCPFKTVIKQIFELHVCEDGVIDAEEIGHDVSEEVRKAEDVGTVKVEPDATSKNTKTGSTGDDEAVPSRKEIDSDNKTKCFDCKFSCIDRGRFFKKHICRHMGSKYECMEHPKIKVEECPKCFYEVTLKNLDTEILKCSTCGYKTTERYKMDRHEKGQDSCRRWISRKPAPGLLQCFECQYVTTHKKFLKYHLVDHLDVEFTCWVHTTNKDEHCLECIYKECLEGAKKEVIFCPKCNFKTAIKKVFKLHECNGKKYRCFDCDEFTCDTTDALREHTVLQHDSNFECDQHRSGTPVEGCSKCSYQHVVQNVKNDVIVCDSCNFRSSSEDIYNAHECSPINGVSDGPRTENQNRMREHMFECFHCDYRCKLRPTLKTHALRHYGQEFKCEDHPGERGPNCRKCIYESILTTLETAVQVCGNCQYKTFNKFAFENHVRTKACADLQTSTAAAEVAQNESRMYKCFDCGVTYHQAHSLKNHVLSHIGSTFKCDDHSPRLDRNCQKCIYEDILKTIETSTFTCSTCGFKAYAWVHLDTHKKNKLNCQLHKAKLLAEGKSLEVPKITIYRCFDCEFSHERKDFFMKHILVHSNSTVQCGEHPKPSEDCSKCLYRRMLNTISRKCRCFECNPSIEVVTKYNLKRHIFRYHKNSSYVCTKHRNPQEDCGRCVYAGLVKKLPRFGRGLVCCDCEDEHFTSKDKLKDHITEFHLRSPFTCMDHPLCREPETCYKCLYEELVPLCESEATSREQVAGALEVVPRDYRCFDCDIKTIGKAALSSHIRQHHVESDYSCPDHTLGVIEEGACPMCRYESALVSIKQSFVLKCTKCTFAAPNKEALSKHYEQHHSKATFMNSAIVGEDFRRKKTDKFTCYDCGTYVTNSQDSLFKHLSRLSHGRNSDVEFKCETHRLYDNTCDKCVFEKISRKVRNINGTNENSDGNPEGE